MIISVKFLQKYSPAVLSCTDTFGEAYNVYSPSLFTFEGSYSRLDPEYSPRVTKIAWDLHCSKVRGSVPWTNANPKQFLLLEGSSTLGLPAV